MRILFFLLTITTFISCIKDSETFVPNKNLGDIEVLLKKLDYGHRAVSINAQVDNTLITDKNEVIFIPANSLRYDNNEVVSGAVEVNYAIYSDRSYDIIKNRSLHFDAGTINGWMNINIQFSQNGKTLKLGNQEGIVIKIPYENISDNIQLNLFDWKNSKWNIVSNIGTVTPANWKLETQNGTIFGTGFSVSLLKEGDYLIGTPNFVSGTGKMCIKLPENHSDQNTVAYVFFEDDKTSYKLTETAEGFCNAELPVNKVGKLIVLSEQNGKYLIGENTIRTASEINFTMVTKEMTIEEIIKILAAL